ncbi:MAG: HAD family hydrolase [Elusimicrobiota bacterium]
MGKGFRAVLFDLDGTLLDTLDDIADSMNAVLRRAGYPEHPLEAYKYFVGDGIRALVLRALPEDRRDDAGIETQLGAMREEYGRRWKDKTRPYAGVPKLLDALSKRGLRMAILSNKPENNTRSAVEALLGGWKFAEVRGAAPGGPLKPDPSGAMEISAALGIPPDEFIYLGDTGIDMKTAVGAGMYAVGALWGFRKADELLAEGAKALIQRPEDLLRLL